MLRSVLLGFFCFFVAVNAHAVLNKFRLVCGPNGEVDTMEALFWNDYKEWVDFDTRSTSSPNDFPAPYANAVTRLGQACTTVPGGPRCDSRSVLTDVPWSWYSPSTWPNGPVEFRFTLPLVKTTGTYPFKSFVFKASRLTWNSGYYQENKVWNYQPTTSDVNAAACPPKFNCPNPPTTTCSVGTCPNSCNKFEFLRVQTDTTNGRTAISVNVTNKCRDSFYYAAFGLTNGISLVQPTVGSQNVKMTNYNWNVATVTANSINWVRFVATTSNGYTAFSNSTLKNWEVFNFTVAGYVSSTHEWTVQAHEGAIWETFTGLDVSQCPCPNCDSTTTNGCPPGYSGPNCDKCDTSPPPGGYTWFCLPTSNPSNPWQLVKVANGNLGTSPYVAPGFVPYNATGSNVRDPDGFIVECNCTRRVYDCEPLNYCNGVGTCNPKTDECTCPPGYLPPDCRQPPPTTTPAPPTTTPAATTPPPPTTTLPGQTTPVPTTTTPAPTTTTPAPSNPPCYNDGKFCSGKGVCENGVCVCVSGFEGVACDGVVQNPNERHCDEFLDCQSCRGNSSGFGLNCSWCGDVVGGGCVRTDFCNNIKDTCGATGVGFVAEPCPDDCSGSGHGVCVNQSCKAYEDAGEPLPRVNGELACWETPEPVYDPELNITVTPPANNESYCVCKKGYKGINCGGKANNLGKALAISGGVIAAIVICGVIAIVLISFAAKKGVDFVLLNQQAASNFKNNPIEEPRNKEYTSALHG